jgi:hypothetical protein
MPRLFEHDRICEQRPKPTPASFAKASRSSGKVLRKADAQSLAHVITSSRDATRESARTRRDQAAINTRRGGARRGHRLGADRGAVWRPCAHDRQPDGGVEPRDRRGHGARPRHRARAAAGARRRPAPGGPLPARRRARPPPRASGRPRGGARPLPRGREPDDEHSGAKLPDQPCGPADRPAHVLLGVSMLVFLFRSRSRWTSRSPGAAAQPREVGDELHSRRQPDRRGHSGAPRW